MYRKNDWEKVYFLEQQIEIGFKSTYGMIHYKLIGRLIYVNKCKFSFYVKMQIDWFIYKLLGEGTNDSKLTFLIFLGQQIQFIV